MPANPVQFKVFDNLYKHRFYEHYEEEVQFKNHEALVSSTVAYHMARTMKEDEFILEKKFVPFNSDSWEKERRMIWGGNVSTANGFGSVAENTIRQLLMMGVNVSTWGGRSGNIASGSKYADPIVDKAIGKPITPDCLEIQHCQPPAFKKDIVERKWIYTMFETTHTPQSWIKMLNDQEVERIIVPSKWLVDSWREQGVKKPIDVVGHGIDDLVYHYLERPEHETYTFIHYCQLSFRKGTDIVAKAFVQEFEKEKDVKLILKNVFPFFPVKLGLPKVEYMHKTLSKKEMREFLRNADCMVFPSRGEGFGLPPFEALATGLPTIVTNWSGTADYSDPNDTLLLNDIEMVRAKEFDMIYHTFWEEGENAGYWAEPNIDEVRAKMRWAYEHRSKAKEMGKRAAKRIAENWTWQKKIQELVNIIEKTL